MTDDQIDRFIQEIRLYEENKSMSELQNID